VVVTAAGGRTTTGSAVVTSGTFSAGSFSLTGTGSSTFGVTYPASFNVTSAAAGATPMAVTITGAATGTLSAGAVTLPVGGILTVGANQIAGSYTGTYVMTVEYN
jgi:hypothetical protein